MRKLILLGLLAAMVLPAGAAKRVTVDQLEQILNAFKGKPDAEVARHLSDLELTERFSSTRLSRWKDSLSGDKSRQVLIALADVSEFLDPPAAEIPATATPDLAAQRQIMALVVRYVSKTIPELPNFFATRQATRYENTPLLQKAEFFIPYEPLHSVGVSSATVLYRDGREVVDPGADEKSQPMTDGLTTVGAFGPILATVLLDAAQSKLAWSRWEQGTAGLEAVFNYAVPREKSHYEVNYCCVAEQAATVAANLHPFHKIVGYHGEITVDPASGTILRLSVEAGLKPTDPVSRAGILVEYGPVQIGGKTYFCPVRNVSVAVAQIIQYKDLYKTPLAQQMQPLKTLLNDVAFDQYHLFRAEARVVTGNDTELASVSPPPEATDIKPADAVSASSHSEATKPAEAVVMENSLPVQSPTDTAQKVPVVSEPGTAPVSQSTPTSESEITMTAASGVPDEPANEQSQDPGYSLKVNARLVDVGIVVYDKKGHPVKDLKQEDFEVYDNGRKQEVRFFSQFGNEVPTAPSAAEPPDRTFTNRSGDTTAGPSAATAPEAGATVLLIDESHISWSDTANARQQILKFLATVAPGERVGLYTMTGLGFRVLAEIGTDHAALIARLQKWMPTAQSVSQAQDEEVRNRQLINEVHNVADLNSVNGNHQDVPDSASPVDPQLLTLGSNPARASLIILGGVARHLSTVQGHKNLVWVSSDNVFADWRDREVSIDKGDKYLDSYALRAQEAMNDAHVAVYPMDVSQLETAAIGADVRTRNVELTPAAKDTASLNGGAVSRNMTPGRITAEMQQDMHPIQGPVRQVADGTGGRAIRRAGDLATELDGVVEAGHATYLLSFSPQGPADDKYHIITVKLTGKQHGLTPRYRSGYLFQKEPSTFKDRFRQAVWRPAEANEISVTANVTPMNPGANVKIGITAGDLGLRQQNGRWMDRLDIFFIQRDDAGLHAEVEGQTLGLRLKSSTYQSLMLTGVPFERFVQLRPGMASLRVLVVDENTRRIGSVTIPSVALEAGH